MCAKAASSSNPRRSTRAAAGAADKQSIAPVYALSGSESFLRREALADLMDRLLGDADRALALAEYDGSSASLELADVLDDVRTLPFLVERKVVLVREADQFISRYRDSLEKYVDQPCKSGILVLDCSKMASNTRLYKAIANVGQVIVCEPVAVRQIRDWLTQRAKGVHGKQLGAPAAELLIDQIGPELGMLDTELAKLSLYVGERPRIEAADVEALVGRCREEQIWGLLTAMAARNAPAALKTWEEVWQTDRAASARAVAGIAFTVRRLLNAKRAEERGAPSSELSKLMMIWGDERRLRAELSAFSIAEVESMLCELLEIDVAGKSGGVSVRTAIESLIVRSCQRPGGRRQTGA